MCGKAHRKRLSSNRILFSCIIPKTSIWNARKMIMETRYCQYFVMVFLLFLIGCASPSREPNMDSRTNNDKYIILNIHEFVLTSLEPSIVQIATTLHISV